LTSFIPEEKIAEIRNAADIVDVISGEVLLKKGGKKLPRPLPLSLRKDSLVYRQPRQTDFLLLWMW